VIDQLILVRHGETVHNVAGIAQGWNDSALSTAGEEQVLRLAERLAVQDIGAIFSSPLSRAMATARVIAAATRLQIHTVDELREMNYGLWEGRAFHEVRRDDASAYEQWIADPDAACPNGESHNDLRKRLDRAFHIIGISASNGGPKTAARRIVVVTHGTAIRVAATALLELPVMASRHFAQDNASMNVFVWRADRYVLKAWNDTTHCS
jgi:broad specificity phosphatase PhoE